MRMCIALRRGTVDGVPCFALHPKMRGWLRAVPILAALSAGAVLAGCDIVPMPEAALLKPQPPPKCDAKRETDATDDAARLRKLDYEAQCYRHAEMIARSRLGRLQESVRQTARVAKPPPKCDAKREAAATDGTARLRQLDYEVQCYRHAEMIARGRLGRLQESVRDTVRTAKAATGAALRPE
jgi:hypothetical protein